MRQVERPDNKDYNKVFIVENMGLWETNPYDYDINNDLVLTYDFGVYHKVRSLGGKSLFVDHIEYPDVLERYNYLVNDFLMRWHYDKNGKDIFEYKRCEIGNVFRLEIWNDIVYYCRLFANLNVLRSIRYKDLYIGVKDPYLHQAVARHGYTFRVWSSESCYGPQEYYFPIFRWLEAALFPKGISHLIRSFLRRILETMLAVSDIMRLTRRSPKDIYVQNYYPTRPVIKRMQLDGRFNIIADTQLSVGNIFNQRTLPSFRAPLSVHKKEAERLIEGFKSRKHAVLRIADTDIEDDLYGLILKKVSRMLPHYLRYSEEIDKFLSVRDVSLLVPTGNVGAKNCLMLNKCRDRGIKSFLIINGLLMNSFMHEAKEADYINSYSESIKTNYFKGGDNVMALGDPRMDAYPPVTRSVNRVFPEIMIGTAGYCSVELNTFLACDFEFLFETLSALNEVKGTGKKMRIVLRVRADGYEGIYSRFIKQYFPGLEVEYRKEGSFADAARTADLYISIGSQTLFEASCLGIPVIYHKNDTQLLHKPFNGNSELVTSFSVRDLKEKVVAFYEGSRIFDPFLDRNIMERYVGPLDKNSLQRNIDLIYTLANGKGK